MEETDLMCYCLYFIAIVILLMFRKMIGNKESVLLWEMKVDLFPEAMWMSHHYLTPQV